MRAFPSTLLLGGTALALAACSAKTKDSAADTATAASKDMSDAAVDVRDAASEGAEKIGKAADRAEEAADKLGARIKQGADEAKDALKAKPSEAPK